MLYTYIHNDKTYNVQLEKRPDGRYEAKIEDRVYIFDAHSTDEHAWILKFDQKQVRAHAVKDGERRFVHVEGEHYEFTVPSSRRKRGGGGSSGDLSAQMPGQIVEVLVSEGDQVEQGQDLVIMEAMKMEIRISAPQNGIVKKINVQQGDVVERGQTIVEVSEE